MAIPSLGFTGRGSTPSSPNSLEPHAYTSPKSQTATVCRVPATASVMFTLISAATSVGSNRGYRSPCPSCPYSPPPHVYTLPSRDTARAWYLDADTFTASTPSNARTGVGTITRCPMLSIPTGTKPKPWPSCPTSPYPQVYTCPPAVAAAAVYSSSPMSIGSDIRSSGGGLSSTASLLRSIAAASGVPGAGSARIATV